jgi:thiosulfate dehydrogenase (quinone) large subunit
MLTERSYETPATPYALALLRIAYGILWLQQVLWKIPPDFGLARGDGLYYWTQQMALHSFLAPHKFFVTSVVLPHFLLFGWLTFCTEIFIAASQLLGLFTRLGALAAFGMATNLLIGLARHPSEWPWSYLMLIGFALLFLSTHAGRVFGVDGVLARRVAATPAVERRWARAFALLA